MRARAIFTAGLIALYVPPLAAQDPGLGEVLVTANRQNVRYAQADRPAVGLRRRADAAVMQLTVTSDTRDETARKQEIHTALLGALDRAAAAGFELVSGNVQLERITKANYKDLPFQWAGRADTGKVDVLVKARLGGSAAEAQARLLGFVRSLKGNGRATIGTGEAIALTVVDPDQYRDAIVALVAADAKHTSAMFGPDFTFNVTGIDGQVGWSQVSSTEVFLYLPYRYAIIPRT